MTSILDELRGRSTFAGEGGKTGAKFERAQLRDGTPVILKHVTPDDWMMALSDGVSYHERLWSVGVFDRIPEVIEHATIAVEHVGDGFVVVMRDVSKHVLDEGRVLTREENRRVLRAADAMYREFWDEVLPGCPLYDHFVVFSPGVLDKAGPLDTPIPGLMRRGWDMFGDVAPPDVTEAMRAIITEPAGLVREFDKCPSTLIHGDLRLHNIGLTAERVVLLDWEITGNGPPSLDFGWYLVISASRIDATREQVIDDFREISADHCDDYALELGLISGLVFLGWNKAIDILENPDPAIRAQEGEDLDWWIGRVRASLEVWSPT